MRTLQRRRALELLTSGGLASLAGCSGVLADRDQPECAPRMGLRLRETSEEAMVEATDRPLDGLHPLGRDLVRTARASGTATYDCARWWPSDDRSNKYPGSGPGTPEPFPISQRGESGHRYVRLQDGYYRMIVERGLTAETTKYVFVVQANSADDGAAGSGDALAFDALPTHDQRAVLALFGHYTSGERNTGPEWLAGVGYLRDEHVESSKLIPRPNGDSIEYRDLSVRFDPSGTRRETRAVYDLSLDHVADTTDEFAAAVEETDCVDLDGANLSAAQRDLLDEATQGFAWSCLDDSSEPNEDDVEWVDRDGADDGYAWSTFEDLVETMGTARYVIHDGTRYSRHERRRG